MQVPLERLAQLRAAHPGVSDAQLVMKIFNANPDAGECFRRS